MEKPVCGARDGQRLSWRTTPNGGLAGALNSRTVMWDGNVALKLGLKGLMMQHDVEATISMVLLILGSTE